MRFIIHELPYERPVAAGRLRYERDGTPTGAVENWRVTDAVDGFRFLRVDLDARDAASGRTYLYHVTLNGSGRPEALKFRVWDGRVSAGGAVILEGNSIVATREVNGRRFEETARGDAFWFPSALGLAMLRHVTDAKRGVLMATGNEELDDVMTLVETSVSIEWKTDHEHALDEKAAVQGVLDVSWPGNRRTLWLDEDGNPLRLVRDDGLIAVAERVMVYSR